MDCKIIPFSGYQSHLLEQELYQIEKCMNGPISPRTCKRVFHQLEVSASSLASLKTHSKSSDLDAIEEKIVSLFGRAVGKKVDYQIQRIEVKMNRLEECLDQRGPVSELKKQSKTLDRDIKNLLHDHCVSKEHLQVIEKAKKTITLAKQTLSPASSPSSISTTVFSKPLLELSHSPYLHNEVEELFNIAVEIFTTEPKNGRSQFICLPNDIQQLVEKKCVSLGIKLFEDAESTMKALVTSAFELAGCMDVLSSEESVTQFLTEAHQYKMTGEPVKKERPLSGASLFLLRP
jgi:hypothetical protein